MAENLLADHKTYSQHDLDYAATVTAYTNAINKPAFEAEFGIPQYMGDCTWSGQTFNGIRTSRARLFCECLRSRARGRDRGFCVLELGKPSRRHELQCQSRSFPVYLGSHPTILFAPGAVRVR